MVGMQTQMVGQMEVKMKKLILTLSSSSNDLTGTNVTQSDDQIKLNRYKQ